ncbi:MAG: T9SS type A sorting domain-containing protein [Melioribacteraceae bacterium]|nr:T9SS type A sorting domain-containing protein [Melioribacteraceae bacterium]MCF8356646.1 T9SS type A sorting domain-containing protein [Melioribacteraceae bacterium]MCF8396020.1 T9SS type A sorting domain-containing protein [Melioribacteraceae bacterium]MCF8421055.1 T9SS type A sorting domain-containing protein [Melioribacteraceae bacterium]
MTNLKYFLTVIVISSQIFSQSTFDRVYWDVANEAYQIESCPDGNYLISARKDSLLHLLKIDLDGNILFDIAFENFLAPSTGINQTIYRQLLTTTDDQIIFGGKVSEGENYYPGIKLLNLDGELIWEKVFDGYDFGSNAQVVDLAEIDSIGYFLLISSEMNIHYFLLKIDLNGNLIFSNDIGSFPSFVQGRFIEESNDGMFYLSYGNTLAKINEDNDTLWSNTGSYPNFDLIQVGDTLLVDSRNIIRIINSEGTFLYSIPTGQTMNNSSFVLPDHKIVSTGNRINFGSKILQMEFDGSMIWEKDMRGVVKDMILTTDNKIMACGFYLKSYRNYSLWISKINLDGSQTALDIILSSGRILQAYTNYTIEWYQLGVENVDIDYSIDGGSSWDNITSNYPADSSYVWGIPGEFTDQLFFRITDSDNEDIFTINNTPLQIKFLYEYEYIAANDVQMWVGNNGDGSHDPRTDGSGYYWPGGEDATLASIFEDGLVFGCVQNGEIKFNAGTHRQGLSGGAILESGEANDPGDINSQVFKLKKNWEIIPRGIERDKYEYMYINWPGEFGAPFVDIDNDGIFTSGIDEPENIGNETLWYVSNDLDTNVTRFTYGSDPIGLEIQTTTWAYYTADFLKDVVFKKYKIINKSGTELEDFYLGQWSDPDLGDANDDYYGCDTNLSLGYTYNADNLDEYYYEASPPAVGYLIVQGPITESSPTDSAYFNGKWIAGYRNLPMTSSVLFINSGRTYRDPQQGIYEGTTEFYNYLQGKIWDGSPILDPNTGDTTKFVLAGDPVYDTGWYEGDGWPDGPEGDDRRFLMGSGPFNLAVADTQEIVMAIYMARGSDNINSIAKLKERASLINEFYYGGMVVDVDDNKDYHPNEFTLFQNYPNPFNPTTTIEFAIPNVKPVYSQSSTQAVDRRGRRDLSRSSLSELKSALHTKLIVYDVLGREVKTLINQPMKPGMHKVKFNAGGLASGVYFYRIIAGDFVNVKKMMVIK